jgi:hypothetical protein
LKIYKNLISALFIFNITFLASQQKKKRAGSCPSAENKIQREDEQFLKTKHPQEQAFRFSKLQPKGEQKVRLNR